MAGTIRRLTITHDHPYTDAGRDQGPKPLTLAPGESVKSVLNRNNRVTSFDAVTKAPIWWSPFLRTERG
ncbi:hypothetical protein ACWGI0_34210 [Streptomyces sp. NPDC054802]